MLPAGTVFESQEDGRFLKSKPSRRALACHGSFAFEQLLRAAQRNMLLQRLEPASMFRRRLQWKLQ